ncbi:MAG TPA: glycoside hydrolase family 3 N-terminal domain-containing protein, partial [Candidatus Polarisedimenticolaceae bacterium]|nr:glycoside hydrolase family 3 N-terminal domain-containing protein [Candidatus Polarisedimenticolaceae bacterium]
MESIAAAAGRVLMVGVPGPELDLDTAGRLRALGPGGAILFRRNLESVAGAIALLGELQRLLPAPALHAIDQEGGRVSRLEPWIGTTPSADALRRAGESAVAEFARATADAVRSLGFNVDFAPVVDLCGPDAPNGIAERSFGTDPAEVARLAGRMLDGLQSRGVAGCLKHFPGLGDTSLDSHLALPTVLRTRERLEAEDLVPYRQLAPRAASVMIGHGYYPAWDREGELPATCSSRIVRGLLREELGYRGLAISDDLEMGAISPLDAGGAAAVRAIAAGCDLLLYCGDLERAEAARDALASAAAADSAF